MKNIMNYIKVPTISLNCLSFRSALLSRFKTFSRNSILFQRAQAEILFFKKKKIRE